MGRWSAQDSRAQRLHGVQRLQRLLRRLRVIHSTPVPEQEPSGHTDEGAQPDYAGHLPPAGATALDHLTAGVVRAVRHRVRFRPLRFNTGKEGVWCRVGTR